MVTKITVEDFLTNLPHILRDIGTSAGGTHAHEKIHEMMRLAEEVHNEMQSWPRTGTKLKIVQDHPMLRGVIVLNTLMPAWATGMQFTSLDEKQAAERVHK